MRKLLLLTILVPSLVLSQEMAFPGAEGYGKFTTGGRGGKVLVVTNLNDDGEGSLRRALKQDFPRIIVFSVSGTIELESALDIRHGNVSILGQSAPGDGITLKNYEIKAFEIENVIIRYIRSRMGDESGNQGDAISVTRCKNVIIDHCSFSWATDECASFYDNENATVQYCIISESLNESVHAKGEHGYGGIWGGKKATFHHNLFAHHTSRNPRFQGARYHKQPDKERVDFRNNVIYNWRSNNSYGGEQGNHNVVNNYYKAGPATASKKDKILDPYEPFGAFYLSGNVLEGDEAVTSDNWEGVNNYPELKELKLNEPLEVASIYTESARDALQMVLLHAGASKVRDQVDERIVQETKNGTASFGNGIINSQTEVGGWPILNSGNSSKDADRDGMPDEWEQMMGLNPNDPNDAAIRSVDVAYSNVEVFLNELTQAPRDPSYTLENVYNKHLKNFPDISIPAIKPSSKLMVLQDVVYKEIGARQLMADVYYPKKIKAQKPGVVIIHGGGWRAGDKSLMKNLASKLAEVGYVVMAPEYRMSMEAGYVATMADLNKALEYFRTNAKSYGLDPKKVVVMGCSAGGQLAALLGTTQSADRVVQGIVNIDGVLKFKHPESEESGMAAAWLGGDYDDIPEVWEDASPLNHVSKSTPPTLFIGSNYPRFLAGHKEFMEALKANGTTVRKVDMGDAPHSFWLLNPWFEPTTKHTIEFLTDIFND
jgi:acetyl esterase/lipase/pectate lyase